MDIRISAFSENLVRQIIEGGGGVSLGEGHVVELAIRRLAVERGVLPRPEDQSLLDAVDQVLDSMPNLGKKPR